MLTETILPSLQTGELAPAAPSQDQHPAAPQLAAAPQNAAPPARPAPAEPASAKTDADPLGFAAAVAGAPALRAGMAAGAGSSRLCALLGAAPADGAGARGSMALGYCGPPERLALASRWAPAIASSDPEAVAEQPSAARRETIVASRPETARRAEVASKPEKEAPRNATAKKQGAPGKPRGTGEIMIPPGAKYVQIGAFRDPKNAERTAQRLGAMGFPVVRSKGAADQALQLVLVGPLDGREAMVRAIDQVRRAGYRDAYPRR